MSGPVPRVGGRVLVVDPDDRLLLIHERLEGGGTHWLTPGGGVEDGEDPVTAAAREAYEEVGLRVDPGLDAVLVTRRQWSWQGTTYDQTDHFYLARVPAAPALQPQGLTPMEQQTVLGHDWWTVPELRATSETVVPPGLGDELERVLRAADEAG